MKIFKIGIIAIILISTVMCAACTDSRPQGNCPIAEGKITNCGGGSYYFPFVGKEFGVAFGKFMDDNQNLEVTSIFRAIENENIKGYLVGFRIWSVKAKSYKNTTEIISPDVYYFYYGGPSFGRALREFMGKNPQVKIAYVDTLWSKHVFGGIPYYDGPIEGYRITFSFI